MTDAEQPSTHMARSPGVEGRETLSPASAPAKGHEEPRARQPLRELTRAERRRLVAIGLLKALVTTALLVTAYYVLPFDHLTSAATLVFLVLGLVGVAIVVIWEVRVILDADHPQIQAIEALAMIAPLFLLLFASTYYLIAQAKPTSFGQHLTRTDALYFTVTTFSTVGYGDITAKTDGARIVVMFQMLADLVVLGFAVKVILGAVQMGLRRAVTGSDDADAPVGVSPRADEPIEGRQS
jgi:hypothetical protein